MVTHYALSLLLHHGHPPLHYPINLYLSFVFLGSFVCACCSVQHIFQHHRALNVFKGEIGSYYTFLAGVFGHAIFIEVRKELKVNRIICPLCYSTCCLTNPITPHWSWVELDAISLILNLQVLHDLFSVGDIRSPPCPLLIF